MKPIKLYFAGDQSVGGQEKDLIELGIKNRLVSYAYPEQFDKWLRLTKKNSGNIIIDSGAFSAWNKDKSINIDDYIEYAHEAIEKGKKANKEVIIVNLDIIPGKVGDTTKLYKIIGKDINNNKKIINEAAKQGFLNLKKMIVNGIIPIHVFHQGESLRWLDRMLKYTNHIGISPANDLPAHMRKDWMYMVFDYLYENNINAKTHGFAVTSLSILKELPWDGCDSTAWRMVAANGMILYPYKGFSNPDYSKNSLKINISGRRNVKGMGDVIEKKLKLIEDDGYTFEQLQNFGERAKVNVRYYLGFEKWLNIYRKTHEFKPRIKFI